jgi:tyrosine-protein kinase Etk/Wzc
MQEEISSQTLRQNNSPMHDELKEFRKLILLIVSNRYLFIIALISALIMAYLYNKFTIPVYKVSASILIEEDKKSTSTGNDQLLEGFGLMPGMKNLDNQIMVLTSRTLIDKTLDLLPLDIEYYNRGLIFKKSLFPSQPIKIILENGTKLPEDVEFAIKYLGDNHFILNAKSNGPFELHEKAAFGDSIVFSGGAFRIENNEYEWFTKNKSKKLYFMFHSRRRLVANYVKRLRIEPLTKKGSIVSVSLKGTNKFEDLAFLSKLCENFLNISLDKKNNEAIRTIQFIDDQLIGISDSLLSTESRLQKFRTNNRVMNLSAQGQSIIDQAVKLENEKARLEVEAKYYTYLAEYLEKDIVGEVPIAPATIGIIDPGLTKLVSDLADLQGRLYSKSLGDKNPLQSQLSKQVQNVKEALQETLKGMKGANELASKENQNQINDINDRASTLPKTERQLLGFERKYKLNDELYTFLLEKRSVAQMQKASNMPDNEMIDYPEYENTPVRPNVPLVYLLALVAGLGLPFLWIFLETIFNDRIKEPNEINKLLDIPVIGFIPHSIIKDRTIVLQEPDSPISESFRHIRSKMVFFTNEIKSPIILITSSMPNEGKTFTAINLASVYSLMGKKTVLIGFDLRMPKIYNDFGCDNEKGVSTWLIGKDNLEDIIQYTKYENLHLITSGPIPPNPAELTISDKTAQLFKLLKEKYDCIVVDSSPVGSISDTFHLASMSDACLMIARMNITFKELLSETIKDLKNSNIKGLGLLVNDLATNNRHYGYGGKYGYSNNYKKGKNGSKKSFSLLNKIFRNHRNSMSITQKLL